MQKLYCYVDESGHDTEGELFVVSIVVVGDQRDELLKLCEKFEKESSKRRRKWRKTSYESRVLYLKQIFSTKLFRGVLRYSVFHNRKDYDAMTVTAIANAVFWNKPDEKFTTIIYVDALTKTKGFEYSRNLHKLGVPTRKVKGVVKEESNAFIRLADAIAGLIRDVLAEESAELKRLFEKAKRKGYLTKT